MKNNGNNWAQQKLVFNIKEKKNSVIINRYNQ
jgi:hypothetical protein